MFGSAYDLDLKPSQGPTSTAPASAPFASSSMNASAMDASSSVGSAPTALTRARTTDAKPSKSGKQRRLACEPCRARRVKCAWPSENATTCIACDEADLKCPGETQPRKRQKKSDAQAQNPTAHDVAVDSKPDVVQNDHVAIEKYELGGALTFHLIQLCFNMANPCIPGLDYDLFQALLNNSAGVSREMEIAAEALCGAFIAVSVTFSDHELFIGPSPKPEIPFDEPSGIKASVAQYDRLVSFGRRRQDAVQHFATRALKLYAESGIESHPSIEAIYTMLAMDHCLSLTNDGIRHQRRFVDSAIEMFKYLMRRRAELSEATKEALFGPLSHTLLVRVRFASTAMEQLVTKISFLFFAQSLDAQTAAILKTALTISTDELALYFPLIELDDIVFSSLKPEVIIDRKQGWTELGKQVAPIGLIITRHYRRFVLNGNGLGYYISELWRSLEMMLHWLDECEATILRLMPLGSKELTDERKFELLSLLSFHRRNLMRLDLLIHQRIVDAAAKDSAPIALQLYTTSCARVQGLFKLVVIMAKDITRTSALVQARRLFEVLEYCLTWSSIRSSRPPAVAELIAELGITKDMGTTLMNMLALASWSSPLADEQRRSLRNGFNYLTKQATPALNPSPTTDTKQGPNSDPIAPTHAASIPDLSLLSHPHRAMAHGVPPIIPTDVSPVSMYTAQPPASQPYPFSTPLTHGFMVPPVNSFASPSLPAEEASFGAPLPPPQSQYDAALAFLLHGTSSTDF
ncbi:BQ2448_2506 [Microbotryum intermedium]|uniref:BQ2448_2506 protein n=1 Tax=Microbotryum intermedium TaxID=269621 RepID=A0A238FEH5_9BASI|nr:BQ2448_2506 [Microbotryum intermedium]